MTGHRFVLPSSTPLGDVAAQPLGKLTPRVVLDAEPEPFQVLDCFDQSLRLAGRLLLEMGRGFELLSENAASVVQPLKRKPRFVDDFPEGPLKQGLDVVSPLRALLPLGSGSRAYTVLAFLDDHGKTHCRVHLYRFENHAGHLAQWAELESVRGYGKSFRRLQGHLQALGGRPARIGALYDALLPGLAPLEPKPRLRLDPDATAFDVANALIVACLRSLRTHEAGIIADHDTEFLHDYRVQLRKIRSVLSLFKGVYDEGQTAEFKARFSALAQPTGPLRDLDVYLLKKHEYHALLPESLHGGLDALFDRLTRKRAAEKIKLVRHLRSSSYKAEISALQKCFSGADQLGRGSNSGQPAHDYADERIWGQYRKLRRAAAAIRPETPDDVIHELRIHCKKLRYLMEFFAPLYRGPSFARTLKRLKGLQEHLGHFNDYSVQQEKLQADFLKPGRRPDPAGIEVAHSVGALIAVLHRRQLNARVAVLDALEAFNRPEVRRAFNERFQSPGE